MIAGACLALSLLTYFQFPGHTWLQQDTQIYAPILEHLHDPIALRNELLASKPHVAYTLYDEIAVALRGGTGLGFQQVLAVEQILARAFGIWGLYLMALPLCGPNRPAALALFAAGICALGAVVAGPSVLTFEYEATPRAFALPLALCAAGLTVHRRDLEAGIAGAAAFVFHAPTALPVLAVCCAIVLWPARRNSYVRGSEPEPGSLSDARGSEPGRGRYRLWMLAPLGGAVLVLAIAAAAQSGGGEAQTFFARLTPDLERLQRMRASYNWISDPQAWPRSLILHYIVVFGVLLAAFARLRREAGRELRLFLLGLPALGILSLPASWLLLDHWRWALIPQVQPMRCVLFVTLFMQLLTAVAGARAAGRRRLLEAVAWFAAAYLPPIQPVITQNFALRGAAVALALAAVAWLAVRLVTAGKPAALALGLAAYLAIPGLAGVTNYTQLRTPEVEQLSIWASSATRKDSVFHFADSGKSLDPGIFRAEAERAVYVDWKGGGQVNYLPGFAEQWWFRWQQMRQNRFRPRDLPRYEALGIGYIVVPLKDRLPGRIPVYESARYLVYALR